MSLQPALASLTSILQNNLRKIFTTAILIIVYFYFNYENEKMNNKFFENIEYFYYLNKKGAIKTEAKKNSCPLKRAFYQFIGTRQYDLTQIAQACLSSDSLHATACLKDILKKTLNRLSLTLDEQSLIASCLTEERTEISSALQATHLLKLNKKLKKQKNLRRLFIAANKKDLFNELVKKSYRIATLLKLDVSILNHQTFDASEVQIIDRLADFYESLNAAQITLPEDHPLRSASKKASEIKEAILQNWDSSDIDVIAYDADTVEKIGLWRYSPIEKGYFTWKKSNIGHIALKIQLQNKPIISHMMETYEQTPLKLHQLFFDHYQLNWDNLLTAQAKQLLGVDYKNIVNLLFSDISATHLNEHSTNLKKATNSPFNQLTSAFRFTKSFFKHDYTQAAAYPHSMLCSEYAQISFLNRLSLLNNTLKQNYNMTGDLLAIPLSEYDKTFIMPADFLKKWKDALILIPKNERILNPMTS
jgi:hypothetical protein